MAEDGQTQIDTVLGLGVGLGCDHLDMSNETCTGRRATTAKAVPEHMRSQPWLPITSGSGPEDAPWGLSTIQSQAPICSSVHVSHNSNRYCCSPVRALIETDPHEICRSVLLSAITAECNTTLRCCGYRCLYRATGSESQVISDL